MNDPKPTAAGRWKKSIRSARLYADQWAREYVKLVYHCCATCGSRDQLEWAHVLSGKGYAIRWELMNMTRQCVACNRLHEYEPQHLYEWFVKQYGQPALFRLTVQSNTLVKYHYRDIMKIGAILREKCNSVKQGYQQ